MAPFSNRFKVRDSLLTKAMLGKVNGSTSYFAFHDISW